MNKEDQQHQNSLKILRILEIFEVWTTPENQTNDTNNENTSQKNEIKNESRRKTMDTFNLALKIRLLAATQDQENAINFAKKIIYEKENIQIDRELIELIIKKEKREMEKRCKAEITNIDIEKIETESILELLENIDKAKERQHNLFLDCGGYDGCSVIKHKLKAPTDRCVTFEPNPELAKYYENIPTILIKKAVETRNGSSTFTIDDIDGDGSSLLPNKPVIYGGEKSNDECPKIEVETIDLPSFIERRRGKYNKICLKLDVEGSEYKIIDELINKNTIDIIQELYCEFHWSKIGMSEEDHKETIDRIQKTAGLDFSEEWDAAEYSIIQTSEYNARRQRAHLLHIIEESKEMI